MPASPRDACTRCPAAHRPPPQILVGGVIYKWASGLDWTTSLFTVYGVLYRIPGVAITRESTAAATVVLNVRPPAAPRLRPGTAQPVASACARAAARWPSSAAASTQHLLPPAPWRRSSSCLASSCSPSCWA